ncbi:hypothetical protein B0T16DRAFT_462598 [Cercophora newfieldiana]|uniref:Uncharacterized protein n=1 Tax=Cercophora newfieldiana TaxID=92897 RepID=A0AA39XSJ3_9PEZI|nr:hypothetical protein B0T16DRAFT_462598 [Cercophora newfieldiana]
MPAFDNSASQKAKNEAARERLGRILAWLEGDLDNVEKIWALVRYPAGPPPEWGVEVQETGISIQGVPIRTPTALIQEEFMFVQASIEDVSSFLLELVKADDPITRGSAIHTVVENPSIEFPSASQLLEKNPERAREIIAQLIAKPQLVLNIDLSPAGRRADSFDRGKRINEEITATIRRNKERNKAARARAAPYHPRAAGARRSTPSGTPFRGPSDEHDQDEPAAAESS